MHFNYTTSAQLYIIRIHFFSILQGIAIFLEGVGLQDGISALQPHTPPPPPKKGPLKGIMLIRQGGWKIKIWGDFCFFLQQNLDLLNMKMKKKIFQGSKTSSWGNIEGYTPRFKVFNVKKGLKKIYLAFLIFFMKIQFFGTCMNKKMFSSVKNS